MIFIVQFFLKLLSQKKKKKKGVKPTLNTQSCSMLLGFPSAGLCLKYVFCVCTCQDWAKVVGFSKIA